MLDWAAIESLPLRHAVWPAEKFSPTDKEPELRFANLRRFRSSPSNAESVPLGPELFVLDEFEREVEFANQTVVVRPFLVL